MLQELDIENYAVANRCRVALHAGLNLLTGETGSGKSIIVGSLGLLFGGRASADLVRTGARRARVSGRFDVPADQALVSRLADSGIDCGDDELIVERQVLASGRSRAYLNGTPVTVALLRELAPSLGDIHGQHDQQTLLSPAQQLLLLDAFAKIESDTSALAAAYRRWRRAEDALEQLRGGEQERLQRIDLLRYQVREIRDADLVDGEDGQLLSERNRLANASRLREDGFKAYDALYDASDSASARIKSAATSVSAMAQFDKRLEPLFDSLEEARNIVDDVAFDLRNRVENIEAHPGRQDEIEGRLALLEGLKRKYGPSLAAVLSYAADSETELNGLERRDQALERLRGELEDAAADYTRCSSTVSEARKRAAEELSDRTEAELRDLALARAKFRVDLRQGGSWSPTGQDRISLLFSANAGQVPGPLGQVASGGELSRVALALRTCLGNLAGGGPYRRTLVFDEIDSGVGGRVAEAIGRRLKRTSTDNQVLCVTHLPQIARFAGAHFRVSKSDGPHSTSATIEELAVPQRVLELARMLSGAEVTRAAIANARELLQSD